MISIIGAGPVGCYCGYLLAKAGFKVHIYEEHKEIGKPIQCTGVVTKEINKLIELKKEFIVNKTNKIRVFSPDNSCLEIDSEEIVIDRTRFDQHIAKLAKSAGARINLGAKFKGLSKDKILFEKKKSKRTPIIIGADGPLSPVAKSVGIFGIRRFYTGMQARVKGKFDKQTYETYFGKIAPGFFAWIVPESESVARMGLATINNTKRYFDNFVKRIKPKIDYKKVIDKQVGLIPVYNPRQKIAVKGVYLVGDAALHVKATTGGGLVQGLRAAKILANSIIKKNSYVDSLKNLKKDLWLHLKIRQTLNKFSEKEYNRLIKACNKQGIKDILKSYSRDKPIRLVLRLLLDKPSLVSFIKPHIFLG